MSFPFPQLLVHLKEEKDQVEFMKVASEVGLGRGDVEIAKILVALQLYVAIYDRIPREIKAAHNEALVEIRRARDEAEVFTDRLLQEAARIGQWAEEIHRVLHDAEPSKIAVLVHKRLLDDTIKLLSGSLQPLALANEQIGVATRKMNIAAQHAAMGIQEWQMISLRRIWAIALSFSLLLVVLVVLAIWLFVLPR